MIIACIGCKKAINAKYETRKRFCGDCLLERKTKQYDKKNTARKIKRIFSNITAVRKTISPYMQNGAS